MAGPLFVFRIGTYLFRSINSCWLENPRWNWSVRSDHGPRGDGASIPLHTPPRESGLITRTSEHARRQRCYRLGATTGRLATTPESTVFPWSEITWKYMFVAGHSTSMKW